ncbi:uncharacterized protein LOC134178291 isoform X2 [Corticium candelabrum]|uniref:uncharacterized protein LOC134178291 isoform X2 n=1 Tax=Corticium candelabrum TaxID=121492 RepID=UPI002E273C42|nr:uncharacterized protein LOC134178291 isoform X2 [Corticium candelabrum]
MSWLCSINLLSINIEQGMRQTSLCAAAVVGVSGSLFPSGRSSSMLRVRAQDVDHPPDWFRSDFSASDAEEALTDKREGSFVARDSYGSPGDFALSIKVLDTVQHVLVKRDQEDGSCNIFSMFEVERFPSLEEMVAYYQQTPLHFNQLDKDVLLTNGLEDETDFGHFEDETRYLPDTKVDFSSLDFRGEVDILQAIMKSDCTVLAIGRSKLSVNGQEVESKEENVACVVKDKAKKGFFIRIIDLKNECVVSDKKIDRRFQYDNPKPLVLSYISDNGLTAIGFENEKEAVDFQNEVDGCIQHALDRITRKRAESKAKRAAGKEGNEVTAVASSCRWLKASDFDVDNIPSEWQELFDLAGVKRQDLEDPNTLQFILDFVASQGGLSVGPKTAVASSDEKNGEHKSMLTSGLVDVADSGLGPDAVIGTVRQRTSSRSRAKNRKTTLAQQLNKRLTQISMMS